jgi:sRNA-binding regulator protein Hfq
MELEAVRNFKGKRVKLVYFNNFHLVGTIEEIYKESILFRTDQKSSLILLSDIRSIVGGF